MVENNDRTELFRARTRINSKGKWIYLRRRRALHMSTLWLYPHKIDTSTGSTSSLMYPRSTLATVLRTRVIRTVAVAMRYSSSYSCMAQHLSIRQRPSGLAYMRRHRWPFQQLPRSDDWVLPRAIRVQRQLYIVRNEVDIKDHMAAILKPVLLLPCFARDHPAKPTEPKSHRYPPVHYRHV